MISGHLGTTECWAGDLYLWRFNYKGSWTSSWCRSRCIHERTGNWYSQGIIQTTQLYMVFHKLGGPTNLCFQYICLWSVRQFQLSNTYFHFMNILQNILAEGSINLWGHSIPMAQLQPFLNLDFQYSHPSKDLFPGNLHVENVEDQLGNRSAKTREKLLKISFLQYVKKKFVAEWYLKCRQQSGLQKRIAL